MPKQPVSLTLEAGNLLWLKARTIATKRRSVSETLDALITDAREHGSLSADFQATSVVGTIDIAGDDPSLSHAKSYLSEMFDASLSRPVVVRERAAAYGKTAKQRPRRG